MTRHLRALAAASLLVLALVGATAAGSACAAEAAIPASHDGAAPSDTTQTRNAARSRMRECGHQWSSMKKTGAAAGMTWKDYSQGCLAKP
ncbi:hypothetical protein P7D22_19640 [Lichenihabitans sp. Uapishka_5]|uniref:hypothetical protein n=1 Tax=Lichenihabitans sp. Uapishka_5 TaxID=3037302 RepID=UPI0029E7F1D6|nr:hypothetical protein [Lichenihabitans sp. Uapishka_5]MDX7953381.1 hypothetical protein [Lichenihabitans sp. Uapishka_5]